MNAQNILSFPMRLPSSMEVTVAAQKASAAHLHLITDGHETRLSPVIPAGWIKLNVAVRPGSPAEVKAAA